MARMILRILGRKGRTTIPFSLRKELGLQPGDIVSFTLENDSVKLRREDLCDFEHCPGIMDSDDEITPDMILEVMEELTPDDQFAVISQFIASHASLNGRHFTE